MGARNDGQSERHSELPLIFLSQQLLIVNRTNSRFCSPDRDLRLSVTVPIKLSIPIVAMYFKAYTHRQLANLCHLILCWQVQCHLFVGRPPPFRAHGDISQLIMPLNGDPNQGIGQQPFPCKGHHSDLHGPEGEPVAEWRAGQTVSFS